MKSFYGLTEQYVRKGPLLADKSISDTLLGKPVIIEDAGSDPRVQYPREAKKEGIASVASFPIVLKERVIGVLRLYTSIPCVFSQDDINFLSAVAIRVASPLKTQKCMSGQKRIMKNPWLPFKEGKPRTGE